MNYTLCQRIAIVLENQEHQIFTRKQILEKLQKRYKLKPASISLTIYCYNRHKSGTKFYNYPRLLHYDGKNRYEYLGPDFYYLGLIYQKRKDEKEDTVVGDWLYGDEVIYGCGYYLCIEEIRKRIVKSLQSLYYCSSHPKESIKAKPK